MNINKLQEYRSKSGLTYEQIVAATNISIGTVSKFFTDPDYNPTMDTAVKIITLLGASLDDVCGLARPTPDLVEKSGEVNEILLSKVFHEHNARVVELKERIHSIRTWLKGSVCLNLGFLGLIIFVVIFDLTHPTMGYVQYTVERVTSALDKLFDFFAI